MIEFNGVSKRFDRWAAVDDLTLSIAEGEFCALIGPSGSGKSTTLRMINRLIERTDGALRVDGEDVAHFKAEDLRRRMGYAIQSIGLFPHWTVERNVGAVPELLGWPKARIRDRATELLELLALDADRFRDKYPHQLSGGQQQRVGVARALAADPDILLMDEPFGALDPITRETLQAEISRIHRHTGKTIVFVTHDMDEALRLATRIAILNHGRLAQYGTPHDILSDPADEFVSDFVGREDLGLRLLAIETVASRTRPDGTAAGEPIPATASLRSALSAMIARGVQSVPVVEADGRPLGILRLDDVIRP